MKEQLRQYILDLVKSPKADEIDEVLNVFEEKTFAKGDYFKEPYKTGTQIAFLPEGAVRIFIFKENGDEATIRIREKNAFLMDFGQLTNEETSAMGIECLEEQVLLLAKISDFNKLLETNLALNVVVRKHMKEQITVIGKQQMLFIKGSAKERYQFILDQQPSLLKKFPLRFIASMIGITPTQLSRVRNQK